ncbi:MAG: YfhO family protein, partial [Anaerolineae bacterium]|nr:YfhO family protein [Anaerolineae bacterium]
LRWIAAILVAVELIVFGATVEVQAGDPTVGYDHADAVAWLQAQPDGPFRIEGATPLWQPDTATRYGGLYDITGTSNPLTLAAYDAYYWSVGQRGSPTYNFLGAKYVIAAGDTPPGDASFVPVYEADSGVTIYLNTGALPLAHLVYRAEVVDQAGAWEAVHAPDWDPQAVVYVEGGPPLDTTPPEGANLFFTVYEPNTLAVVVRTDSPAYLVLSEVWYPGWQASIDGEPVPLYRANTAFRAVYVPEPGEHTVLLSFRPASVGIGLAITGVTLLALVGWAVLAWKRR